MEPMSKTSFVVGAPAVRGSAKALAKGIALVEVVANLERPLPSSELAALAGLPRPTAQRLLDVLLVNGLLSVSSRGEYSLGPVPTAWSRTYLQGLDVKIVADSVMKELVDLSDETCFLGVREGLQVVYVAKVGGNHSVRLAADVGSRGPLYSTGLGKMLLALADEAVIEELLAEPLRPHTPNTIINGSMLRNELETIRHRGYSTDDMENEDGVRCAAVPIRSETGEVIAAMSLAAPAYRMSLADLRRLVPHMITAAEQVSARLGHLESSQVPLVAWASTK